MFTSNKAPLIWNVGVPPSPPAEEQAVGTVAEGERVTEVITKLPSGLLVVTFEAIPDLSADTL